MKFGTSYNMGLITNNERYNQIIDVWSRVDTRSNRNA
jgi:DNA-directed RNA polymerase subunit beta'